MAVVSEARAPMAHVPSEPAEPGRRSRRTLAAATGVVLVLVGLVVSAPFLVLCGVVLGAAAVIARWLPLDLAVPAAGLACTGIASVVGIAAGVLRVDILDRPSLLSVVLVVVAGLATVVARGGPAVARTPVPRLVLIAYVPAALACAAACLQAASTRAAASWAFYGTDLAQHMSALKDVQLTGGLDYSVNGYPRALHMLLALVSAPTMPQTGATDLLAYDLRLVASADWLALALVLSTAATLTLRLGATWGLRPAVRALAAVLASTALLLTNSFIVAFVYLGAVPSLLAVVTLWAVPLTVVELVRRGSVSVVPLALIGCGATAVAANLWQPLVIVPFLAVVGALTSGRRPTWLLPSTPRSRGAAVTVVAVCAAAALLPMLGVLHAGGSTLASIPGAAPAVPAVVLVLVVLATGWLVVRGSDPAGRALLGAAVGVVIVAAVLLHGTGKLDVTQYYVMKSLWFLSLLLVPVIALGAAWTWSAAVRVASRWIGRLGSAARVVRVTVGAAVLAAFVAFVLPVGVVAGSDAWDAVADPAGRSESARAYDVAADYGTAFAPAVTVPVEVGSGEFTNIFTTHIVSKIISFQTGQPNTSNAALDVCSAVRTVAGSRPAVVVTMLDPDVLRPFMVADGCSDVRVVRVAGSDRVLQHVPYARTAAASRD